MGCGSSSQPAEVPQDKLAGLEGDKTTPNVDTVLTDKVETFKNGTPSPSPVPNQNKQEAVFVEDVSTPAPPYQSNASSQSKLPSKSPSYATPPMGSPGMLGNSLDPFSQPAPSLAPGYIERNEARKIGGFDPEAFRKANKKFDGGSGGPASDWATINTAANNGGNNGGGNLGNTNSAWGESHGSQQRDPQWKQQDYIQSDDIFSSDAPQAYQNNQRMDFRDDAAADPFRAPGGLGHDDRARQLKSAGNKHITNEDDALMDDILGELDDL